MVWVVRVFSREKRPELKNANWRPLICSFAENYTEISRMVSICILEAEIVLGVLYRKGDPQKRGALGFPMPGPW